MTEVTTFAGLSFLTEPEALAGEEPVMGIARYSNIGHLVWDRDTLGIIADYHMLPRPLDHVPVVTLTDGERTWTSQRREFPRAGRPHDWYPYEEKQAGRFPRPEWPAGDRS